MNTPRIGIATHRPMVLIAIAASIHIVGSSCSRTKAVHVGRANVIHDQTAGLWRIEFDLGWSNSFRDTTNWDAAWIFVKFRGPSGGWEHATLSADPGEYSVVGSASVPPAFAPSSDGKGVFVYRSTEGAGRVDWNRLRIAWERTADGLSAATDVTVRVFALPMIYVPTGPFHLGDGEIGNIWGHFQGSEPGEPYAVLSEDSIVLGGAVPGRLGNNDGYGMSGATGLIRPESSIPDDFGSGRSAILPGPFPKGFRAFYVMRYELTQRQYADFLNTLTNKQIEHRNPARSRARPSVDRYTITTIPPFTASVPDRAVNWVSWGDAAAFADWAGLRPMTELEFEKAARGPREPEPGEFAWGNSTIHEGRYIVSGDGSRGEHVGNPAIGEGNAAYAGTMGGDPTRSCGSCLRGPLPVGAFEKPDATRMETGSSWYGVAELSGNLYEWSVTVGDAEGRRYDGSHGDGQLDESGAAAGTSVATWPGAIGIGPDARVTEAAGVGLRGGSWATPADFLRVSNRRLAATSDSTRHPTFGIRLVRTAPMGDPPTSPGNPEG